MATMGSISDDIRTQLELTDLICRSFLFGLRFAVDDTSRDPSYIENHLLSYTFQDYLQSTIAIPVLTQAGILNACKRELRFLLEMSIKLCSVQQQQYESDVATKLSTLQATFESTNISMQKGLNLALIPEANRPDFYQEVGRVYGETSSYIHLTLKQILERVDLVNQGRTSGFENGEDLSSLNSLVGRGLACSLVFLLHAVPEYVAGDLLVSEDGSSNDWYFSKSRFIALIDEHFDYKHERQTKLEEIKTQRWAVVSF